MASSCFAGGSSRLEELPWGVVMTFKPTEADLVGGYLYNRIMKDHGENSSRQPFPELEIYGKTAMVPWAIWDSLEPEKLPHQDYLYFFSRVKKLSSNGKGKRLSRTVGCGGTWSETEPVRAVYVDGVQEPFGKLKKFRYENKDKAFVHHTAWMMEEFSIDHHSVNSSDLVLCRMKRNDVMNKRKRKFIEDEEESAAATRKNKSFRPEAQLPTNSQQQQYWQVSDFAPQEIFDLEELLSGDNGVEEGQGQQIPSAPYVSEDAELNDTSWIDSLLNSDYNFRDDGCDGMNIAATIPKSPSFAQLLGN